MNLPAAEGRLDREVRPHCSHCRFPLPASDSGLRHYGTHTAHQESECLRLLHAEIERLRVGHERYETARRMNPRQWADAWKLNISTGKGFDQIVDDLRPFMRPNGRGKLEPTRDEP